MIGETRLEVSARLDENGVVTAKVIGRCSYGEGEAARDASEFLEIDDEKMLARLGKALESVLGDATAQAMNGQVKKAAAKCLVVAAERGEV
jgi:hypothetical protein